MLVRQRAALITVYAAIGLVFALVARGGSLAPGAVAAFLASLWLGFVLAISFMEAWIKFQAPFLPRHLALDVGRTVFSALHSVEFSLAASLLVLHAVTSLDESETGEFRLLATLVVVFVLQVVWFTPKLELRGDHVIYEQLKRVPDEALTFEQRMLRVEMQNNAQNFVAPSALFHVAFVAGEVLKVVLLMAYILHFLKDLSHK